MDKVLIVNGIGIKIIISISKIRKIKVVRKNRTDKGNRAFEASKPHSKLEEISLLNLKFIGKTNDKINKIKIMSIKLRIIIIIILVF